MKIYHKENFLQRDRAIVQALLGQKHKIDWLVVKEWPVAAREKRISTWDYICNRDGTIRWIYPAGLRRPLFLSTFNSPAPKAKWQRRGIRLLYGLGLGRLVRSGQLRIGHAPGAGMGKLPLKIASKEFAVFTGTVGPTRKAIVAMEEAGEVLRFGKVAIGNAAAMRLRKEVKAQAAVAKLSLDHWRVPAGEMLGPGHSMVENIRGAGRNGGNSLKALHLKALMEMSRATLHTSPGGRKAFLQEIDHRLASLRKGPNMPGLSRFKVQLQGLLEWARHLSDIPMVLAHGDFTPWNMYTDGQKLCVYDWEMAGERPAFFDLFHFVFQAGILVERLDYRQIRDQLDENLPLVLNALQGCREVPSSQDLLRLYLLDMVSAYLLHFQAQEALHPQAWWLMETWATALECEGVRVAAESCRKTFLRELPGCLQPQVHAIMRGAEGALSELPLASDLDILVDDPARAAILAWARQHPLVVKVRVFHQSFMDRLEIHFADGGFLSLDLLRDLVRKGLRLLDAKNLLQAATLDAYKLRRLRPEDQLEYAILFYGLNRNLLPDKYSRQYRNLPPDLREKFVARMYQKYKLSLSVLHLQSYSENRAANLRRQVSGFAFNKFPTPWALRGRYLRDLLRRFVQDKGMVMTFSGVDGAGKSTVLDATAQAIGQAYRRKVKVLRHRPSILPILSALRFGRKGAEKRSVASLPRQGGNRNLISSLLRFSWYYVDYLLGQWYVWLRYERRGYVVLYDRYYFDMIADPERTNFRLPPGLVRFAGNLIRKPALNFLLTAETEAILERKQELSPADIDTLTERYQSLFRKLSASTRQARFINLHNLQVSTSVARILKAYSQTL